MESCYILDMRVDATNFGGAVARVLDWADRKESRYVCVATVHMVMEAYDDPTFRQLVNAADLVTPDGMPLVWSLKLLGTRDHERVYGPELTPRLLAAAESANVPVGFYGSAPGVLIHLLERVRQAYPRLQVMYAESPPFRPLTLREDEEVVRKINESGARILFVGLGCPKQERWMAGHRGNVQAVMLGVGAAFDFLAGTKPSAPRWMQNAGLEWLFRLLTEPRRLWRRYLKHNPRFAFLFILQLLGLCQFSRTQS